MKVQKRDIMKSVKSSKREREGEEEEEESKKKIHYR
jgi:hypothetical protein